MQRCIFCLLPVRRAALACIIASQPSTLIPGMKKDFYELLDTPENASATWVTRVYEQRVQAIESDAALDQKQRAAILADLGAAYRVLSSPVRRADYDALRAKQREGAALAAAKRAFLRRFIVLAGIPLLAGGAYLSYAHRQTQRAEQERLREAAEQEARLADIRRREEERLAAIERDRLEAKRLEEERIERERLAHEVELRGRHYEADTTSFKTPQQLAREKAEQEQVLRKQQQQDELDRNRALMELERQKRFLRESARP
ncbi:MAG TPA: hypothetical protein VF928_06545 [Usitatibacteraceae bacterium]